MAQRTQNLVALILRLSGGGLMLTHGIPKLMKVIGGNFAFADPIGIGTTASLLLTVFAEVICAVCLIIGFKTKWVSVPLMITMLVAVFVVHLSDPLGKKEMGLLYFSIYLSTFLLGGGRYAVSRD